MTDIFEQSNLWKRTLASASKYSSEHAREVSSLRSEFLRMRERVSQLVSQINADMPDYTVHDITHLDALWTTADEIIDDEYPFNPVEAFIFGGAVLLHDAGMTLAAYPGRQSDLEKTPEWRDAVAIAYRNRQGRYPDSIAAVTDYETLREARIDALRRLHPTKARELATQYWHHHDGSREYLIQDSVLRSNYGSAIGDIARSHGLDISELERLRPLNAAVGYPSSWDPNSIKVACLLRCTDAAQLDERRAPRFLDTIARPHNSISLAHWSFQDGLAPAKRVGNALRYTRSVPICVSDEGSWWTCFECLCGVDKELKSASKMLSEIQLPEFAAKAVVGVDSPSSMAQFIPTSGWQPASVKVSASDVSRLVRNLGGSQLYGEDPWVPIRELIQNATDAIRVRALLEREHYGASQFEGVVTVRLRENCGGITLDVEDNGVGMSRAVLTGSLIDFGKSLWFSEDVRNEFPGLTGSLFQSSGRFGIGFFSTFMIADAVRVVSRRFERGTAATEVLEFSGENFARPRLRLAEPAEQSLRISTKVSVDISAPSLRRFFSRKASSDPFPVKLKLDHLATKFRSKIKTMCLMSDCRIDFQSGDSTIETLVVRDSWKSLPSEQIVETVLEGGGHDLSFFAARGALSQQSIAGAITDVFDANGNVAGRAILIPFRFEPEKTLLTYSGGFSSGFCSDDLGHCAFGIVRASQPNVARSSAKVEVSDLNITDWATSQLSHWSKIAKPYLQLFAAARTFRLGGYVGSAKIARSGADFLTLSEVKQRTANQAITQVYPDLEPSVWRRIETNSEQIFEFMDPDVLNTIFMPSEQVLFIPSYALQDRDSQRRFSIERWADDPVLDQGLQTYLGLKHELDPSPETSRESTADRLIRHDIEEWPILISLLANVCAYLGIESESEICFEQTCIGTVNGCAIPGEVLTIRRVS